MKLCDECKEMGCIDTTCRTCFPKDDKSDRYTKVVYLAGNFYPLDDKGVFDNALIQHGEDK